MCNFAEQVAFQKYTKHDITETWLLQLSSLESKLWDRVFSVQNVYYGGTFNNNTCGREEKEVKQREKSAPRQADPPQLT